MVEQTELDNGQPVDTFIGVRPIPVMACGLSGPIRNTIDVVVRDVEQLPLCGLPVSASAALAEPIPSEVIVHPVGQLVAVRKFPPPRHLLSSTQEPSLATPPSLTLAEPWPPALHFLNGGGGRDPSDVPPTPHHGVTAMAISPSGKVIAVCERLRPRPAPMGRRWGGPASSQPPSARSSARGSARSSARGSARSSRSGEDDMNSFDPNACSCRVSVYLLSTGQLLRTLECPTAGLDWGSVAFGPDSTTLATVSDGPGAEGAAVVLWRWRERLEPEGTLHGASASSNSEKKPATTTSSSAAAKAPQVGRLASGVVPERSKLNRIRFMPAPTGGNEADEPPPALTTSGGGHLGLWRYPQPKDHGFGAEDSDGSGEEEDHFGSYGGSPKAMLGSNLTASSSAVPLLPLHVGVPEEPVKLELRSLVGPLPASEASVGVADHCWLTLQSPGAAPYPLLVAVTDRDGPPRTGSARQGRRRSSAQQGHSPNGLRSSISMGGGDAAGGAAAAAGVLPLSPASRSPAQNGAFFSGNSPSSGGRNGSGDGTDSASVYCFDWQGDSVCGNPDLVPPSGRSLLLPGAGAPALVLPLRPLPPQVAPGSSSASSGGESQADEVAATAMCPTPDGFAVCGCGGLVAVVRVTVALPEPLPAESEPVSASGAGKSTQGGHTEGGNKSGGGGDEGEAVEELVKQQAPTLTLVGLLRVGAGIPGAVLGPNGFPAQLGRSSPTSSSSSKPPPLPTDAPLGHRWFVGCSFLPIRNEVLLYTMANQLVTVPMAAIEKAGDGTPQGDIDAIQRITSEHEATAAQARSEGRVLPSNSPPVVSTPLVHGTHSSPILAVSAATDVPLSATVGGDGWVRVWNYLRGSCEVAAKFPGDEPLCVSVHPAGTLVAVGFRDRLKLLSLLHAPPSLHARHEWLVKGVRAVSFSPSGDILAAAVGINVCLYDPYTLAQRGPPLMGHIKPVRTLCWSSNGRRLWSSGNDGNVFGWELFDSKEPGKRLDDAQVLNRSKGYHALLVSREDDSLPVLPPPISSDDEDQAYAGFAPSSAIVPSTAGNGAKAAAAMPPPTTANPRSSSAMESSRRSSGGNTSRSGDPSSNRSQTSGGGGNGPGVVLGSVCVAAGAEGGLREVRWNQALLDSHVVADYSGPVHTSLALDSNHAVLYAGLADGRMRVYKWPLAAFAGTFREVPLHGGARPVDKDQGLQQSLHVQPPPLSDAGAGGGVGGICVVRNGQMVLSGGGDGAFMACAVQLLEPPGFDGTQRVTRQVWDCTPLNAREALAEHNADRRLASIEWLADLKRREGDLHKATTDLKSDLDFGLHQLNTKGAEKLKANALAAAQAQAAAEAASQDMANQIASLSAHNFKDAKRNAVVNTLALEASEEAYEKKLGAAMARYDRLAAKIEATREQAADAMAHNAATATKNFKKRERVAARTLRDLEAQVAKLADDCRLQGRFHRASLLQQEAEYEAEITRLTEAATSEVAAQRQATGKNMAHAQLLAGKASQMERRLREGASANEGVASEAAAVEAVNAKLAFSMRGLEDEIAVKQEALSKATNLGLLLSDEEKELEAFRFVFNAKMSSMEDETPQMNAQKQRLETAIAELNDVLKQEHSDAAALAEEQSTQRNEEAKVEHALAEGQRTAKQLDRITFLFKRDLAELVELGLPPFKLVHGARDLATRYMQEVPPPKPKGAYKDWQIPGRDAATTTNGKSTSKGSAPAAHGHGTKGSGAPAAAGAVGAGGGGGGRSGRPKDYEEGIVLEDLSGLVAREQIEANQKEELATVLRLRNLQWDAAESRRAATGRLQADHLRSMKARFVEAQMMTDELNTLRRENLRSRREEAALERQVTTWQERKKAAKRRGESGDQSEQGGRYGHQGASSSSISLASLRSVDDDDLSLRSPGSHDLQLPSVSEGPSVAATAQFLPSDAENEEGFSLDEALSVGAATHKGRPPHGLTQKGRPQQQQHSSGGGATGDDASAASDASTQGPLSPSQWLHASELTEMGSPSNVLDSSADFAPPHALGSPVPPGYVANSSNASGHSSPTNGHDADLQGNSTSLPVPLLLPLLEVTKKMTVPRAIGGAKSPTEYRAYPPGQAPGSFQLSALQEAEKEHDDLLMAVQRSRHAVAAQQAELDELRRLASQLKLQPRVGPGSSILLGPRPKGTNSGGGLRVKRARGAGVGFAHDPARDAAAAAAAAETAVNVAAGGERGSGNEGGGVSGGDSVISISSSGVEGGPSLGAVSMVETVYAPQWDKASGDAAAAPSFDDGSVNSDGRPASPNVDMESPLKPPNA